MNHHIDLLDENKSWLPFVSSVRPSRLGFVFWWSELGPTITVILRGVTWELYIGKEKRGELPKYLLSMAEAQELVGLLPQTAEVRFIAKGGRDARREGASRKQIFIAG